MEMMQCLASPHASPTLAYLAGGVGVEAVAPLDALLRPPPRAGGGDPQRIQKDLLGQGRAGQEGQGGQGK